MKAHTAELKKLSRAYEIVVNIKVTRQFKIRVALARMFFIAGAFVLGASIDVRTDTDERDG